MAPTPKPRFVLPDLKGPGGNAFVILADAIAAMKRSRYPESRITAVKRKMMEDDYDHLLDVLFEEFEVVRVSEYVRVRREDVN
jgi:hypothetical protein